MANQSIYDAFEQMWEHTKAKLNGKSDTGHTHVTTDITSGTLGVARGGTGASTFASGTALIGNGTGAIATRNITNMTALGYIAYNANLMTTNTLAYWDGSYNLSGNSNLTYCNRGAFGTIVTKNTGDYLSSVGGTVIGEITSTNPNGFRIAYGGYGTFLRNDGDSFYLLFTNKDTATGTWNNLRPFAVKLSTGHVNIGNGMTVAGGLGVNANLLSITNNGNTITIGSQNATWGHFINSADIPFYFNKHIEAMNGFHIHNTTTKLRNNELTFSHGGGWYMSDTYWIRAAGNKSVYTAGHFQSDAAFQGPGRSSSWVNGRDNAKFKVISQTGYTPALSIKTYSGSWETGSFNTDLAANLGDSEAGTKNWLLFDFVPDDYYSSGTNNVEARLAFTPAGAIYARWLHIGNGYATGSTAQITDNILYTDQNTYTILPPGDNSGVIVGKTIFGPYVTKVYNLGNSNYRWKQLYATTPTINTSDRNLKKDFRTFDSDDRYTQFFMDLKPIIFKFKDGESGRNHFGFIAQDVEDSLFKLNFTTLDFAGLCKDAKCVEQKKPTKEEIRNGEFKIQEELPLNLDENGNVQYEYSLRYEEFISLNTYMIQKLYNKIESLENEIKLLKKG